MRATKWLFFRDVDNAVCNAELNQVKGYDKNEECDNCSEINWLLDSTTQYNTDFCTLLYTSVLLYNTDHSVNNENYFCNHIKLRNPIDGKLPNDKILKATKLGTVKTVLKNYYNKVQVELKNVYFVEGIKRNLLSFSKITESNTIVAGEQNAIIFTKIEN